MCEEFPHVGSREYYDRCVKGEEYRLTMNEDGIEASKKRLAYRLRRRIAGEVIPVRPMEIFDLFSTQIIDFDHMKDLIIGYPYTFDGDPAETTWQETVHFLMEAEGLLESEEDCLFSEYVEYHVQKRYPYNDIMLFKESYGFPYDEPLVPKGKTMIKKYLTPKPDSLDPGSQSDENANS